MEFDINAIIIPGKEAGNVKIGWTYVEMINNISISFDKSNPSLPDYVLHEMNGKASIFLSQSKTVQEICVGKGYKGKVNGVFGIGDCLVDFIDLVKYETNFADSEGFFYFPQIPGIRVLTADWNEKGTSPITFISVFDFVLGTVY